VRLAENVQEQAELVQQTRCAWLQDFSPELAVEGLVPFEHGHLGSTLGEE
jgi:hypothetical protein